MLAWLRAPTLIRTASPTAAGQDFIGTAETLATSRLTQGAKQASSLSREDFNFLVRRVSWGGRLSSMQIEMIWD